MERTRTRFSAPYLDWRSGLRVFVFAVLLASIAGVYVRLQISPEKLKKWGNEFELPQPLSGRLVFKTAHLRLSEGGLPLFAVELREVRIVRESDCPGRPGLVADKMVFPLLLRGLIQSQFRLGTITGENVAVDVEALKGECAEKVQERTSPVAQASQILQPTQVSFGELKKQAWWREEDLARLQNQVKGVTFSNVQVFFENRKKNLSLKNFQFLSANGDGEISLQSELVLPPALTYDEVLPPLKIEAQANESRAELHVAAEMKEGSLKGQAFLQPGPGGSLQIKADAKITNVPLSAMVPALIKSGIAREDFQPRFLWLNCRASIQGEVQGLFLNSPLEISECSVTGKGNAVHLLRAVRQPSGTWEPLIFKIQNLDISQLLNAFNQKAPEGLKGDLGHLSGELEIRAQDDARFIGTVTGARLQIGSGLQSAHQEIEKLSARFEVQDERIAGMIEEVNFKDGEFQGRVSFDLNRNGEDGKIEARIEKLTLAKEVQRKVLNGHFEKLEGALSALIGERPKAWIDVEGEILALNFEGEQLRSEKILIRPHLAKEGQIEFRFSSEKILISQNEAWLSGLQPLFFDHRFSGSWIEVRDFSVTARPVSDGSLVLEKAQAFFEGHKVKMQAALVESSDRSLRGWVALDYPKVKRLKWTVFGRRDQLRFQPESKALLDLGKKGQI